VTILIAHDTYDSGGWIKVPKEKEVALALFEDKHQSQSTLVVLCDAIHALSVPMCDTLRASRYSSCRSIISSVQSRDVATVPSVRRVIAVTVIRPVVVIAVVIAVVISVAIIRLAVIATIMPDRNIEPGEGRQFQRSEHQRKQNKYC
jgi:hypothetical protein